MKSNNLLHADLTEKIIGAAMTVCNSLCPGLGEKLCENALVLELIEQGHLVEQQQDYPVYCKDRFIGNLIPDIIVDRKVIVDAKAVDSFCENHIKQVFGYLAITNIEVGLLLNFNFARLQWKRVVRSEQKFSATNSGPLI